MGFSLVHSVALSQGFLTLLPSCRQSRERPAIDSVALKALKLPKLTLALGANLVGVTEIR